jgi:glycosyltransferase involved in cell wall biosynthesis
MRIALLTNGLFPWIVGGMQKHSSNLLREWAIMGVDLEVYYTQAPCYPEDSEIHKTLLPGCSTGTVRFIASPPSWLPYFPLHHYADCYVESCRIAECFIQESRGVDFVYAQGFAGYKLLRMKQRGARFAPVGCNLHGLEVLQPFQNGVGDRLLKCVSRPMSLWLLRNSDAVLSLGGKLDDLIWRAAPGARILRSGNGIATEWCFEQVTHHVGPRRFVFVGRYTRRKGLHILYEAVRAMQSDANFVLHLVGDIAESDRLSDSRLIYHGPIADEREMRALLREMDVLLCPSLAEGVPTVILEGMACGLAIIATDVGATQELVDESNGTLIPAGNAGSLQSAMLKAIAQDSVSLTRLRLRSLEKARMFLWPRVAAVALEEISGLCNGETGKKSMPTSAMATSESIWR